MSDSEISDLINLINETIDAGRIGVARFLRCHAVTEDKNALGESLDSLAHLSNNWFGSDPGRLYRMGQGTDYYLTDFCKWEAGQAAILTVSVGSITEPRLDLLLIGSKGSIYHRG